MGVPRNTRKELSSFGGRLRGIRHERKLILGDLADATGASIAQLSAIETGHSAIDNELALAIADFLDLSGAHREAFLDAADETREETKLEAQDLFGRRIAGILARKLNTLPPEKLARMYKYCKKLKEWAADRLGDHWVPARSVQQIELVAAEIRQKLQAHSYKIDIISIIEFDIPKALDLFECLIVPIESAPNYFASARIIPVDESRTFVGILEIREDVYEFAKRGDAESIWTIAHELGHLFLNHMRLEREVTPQIRATLINMQAYHSAEWQADAFAASFLMPATICSPLSTQTIFIKFPVSLAAAEKRREALARKNSRGDCLPESLPTQLLQVRQLGEPTVRVSS